MENIQYCMGCVRRGVNIMTPFMSIAHQGFTKGSTVTIQFPTGTASGAGSSSDLSNKVVNFATDGSLTFTGISGPLSPTGWATPVTAGIGSSYWIRFNSITLGGVTTARAAVGTTGTWLALSTLREAGLKAVSTGTTGTSTATVSYSIASDSGGTNIIGSGSYVVSQVYS